MIFKPGMNHQGLNVYRVYKHDDINLILQQGQIWSNLYLLCLYQTNSQVSLYRTIVLLFYMLNMLNMTCVRNGRVTISSKKETTQLQVNSSRQIEENPKLSAIDAILEIRIKVVEGFVCYFKPNKKYL